MLEAEPNPSPTLSKMHEVAAASFPPRQTPGKIVIINHSREVPDRSGRDVDNPAYFLLRHGCPPDVVDMLFTKPGEWKLKGDPNYNPYIKSPDELSMYLREKTAPVYEAVGYSLNTIYKWGYNAHDVRHIDEVTNVTLDLLRRGGYDTATQRRGVIAARGHDLGNLVNREVHPFISHWMLGEIMPGLKSPPEVDDSTGEFIRHPEERVLYLSEDFYKRDYEKRQEQWSRIGVAVRMHDSAVANEAMKVWGEMTTDDMIERMRQDFGPETLALMIADKVDVGRGRISTKADAQEALDDDVHIEANLLGRSEGLQFSDNKDTLIWTLDFTPAMEGEDLERFPQFSRERSHHEGMRARASARTHEQYKTLPVSHFDVWQGNYWNIYLDRTIIMAKAAFALYPELQYMNVVMRDEPVRPGGRSRQVNTYPIYKYEIDAFVDHIKLTRFPKQERRAETRTA